MVPVTAGDEGPACRAETQQALSAAALYGMYSALVARYHSQQSLSVLQCWLTQLQNWCPATSSMLWCSLTTRRD